MLVAHLPRSEYQSPSGFQSRFPKRFISATWVPDRSPTADEERFSVHDHFSASRGGSPLSRPGSSLGPTMTEVVVHQIDSLSAVAFGANCSSNSTRRVLELSQIHQSWPFPGPCRYQLLRIATRCRSLLQKARISVSTMPASSRTYGEWPCGLPVQNMLRLQPSREPWKDRLE